MGRKRTKDFGLPLGVTEKGGVWYWYPPTKRERDERRRLKEEAEAKGERFTIGCTLGPAGSREARQKWAEVSGYAEMQDSPGLVRELLNLWKRDGLKLRPNGEPRADSTVAKYSESLPVLEQRFGQCTYARTAREAAEGRGLGTVDVQRWMREQKKKAMANIHFAVLDNVFAHGVREGKTTYNPCDEVVKHLGRAREREAMPWEVECLRALASQRMGLMMDFDAVVGWRPVDMLRLVRAQGTADGLRVRYKKVGKRWLWEWSPELRRIWQESQQLPGATVFPASPVFPTARGRALTSKGFDADFQRLKRRTRAELAAAGIVDPDTLERHAGLAIVDLQFRDLRSKAHDDAEDLGLPGNEFLGNSRAVARKHYRRRPQRMRPLG